MIDTQTHTINMIICVHINIKRNNGLVLVKVLGKIPLKGLFCNQNTPAAVNCKWA